MIKLKIMEKIIICYHDDMDGITSAAILFDYLTRDDNTVIEMYPMSYGQEFIWDKICLNDTVFMVDFCLQPFTDMVKLNSLCKLIWIDHHISAIKEYEKYKIDIAGFRTIEKAGCQAVWEYLYGIEDEPVMITLIGAADIHKKDTKYNWDTQVLPFHYGVRKYNLPNDKEFLYLLGKSTDVENAVQDLIDEGTIKLNEIRESHKRDCERMAFETTLDGLKCIAINKLTSSMVFDSIWDNTKYDAMLVFAFQKNYWTCSLYTDKPEIDLSVIAKAHGGGGHRSAAGFQFTEFPFELPK